MTRKRKRDGTVTEIQLSAPTCVSLSDYNNMGPIDRSDQMRQAYGIDRKSRRWWLRFFLFLLDVTMVNSYVIYSEWFDMVNRQQTPLSHLLFTTYVIDGLVNNFTVRRQLGPVPGPTPPRQQFVRRKGHQSVNLAAHGLKPKGCCAECSLGVHERVCKKTRFGCVTCNKRLCRDTCHDIYHQRFFDWLELIKTAFSA